MGEAIKNSGLLLGPALLAVLSTVCVFAQHQLIHASAAAAERKKLPVHPNFAETTQYSFEEGPGAFPRWAVTARKAVYACLVVVQLGYCTVYFVFVATNIKQVLDQHIIAIDAHVYMALCLAPILLGCSVRTLKYLVPLSVVSNIFMYSGVLLTLYLCAKDGFPESSERALAADWSRLPLFFGTALFCFEAIAMTMPLRNEMRHPENFSRPMGVLNVASAFLTLQVTVMGCVGYAKYGEDVLSLITLNFDQTDILCQVVVVGICISILLSYPIQAYVPVEILWPHVQKRLRPLKHPTVAELAFRFTFVLFTFLLAESVPRLGLFISLMGSVSSTLLILIFPPLLDWAWRWRKGLPIWRHLANGATLSIGVLGCGWGSYTALNDIIVAFGNDTID